MTRSLIALLFLVFASMAFAETDAQENNTVTVVEERPATPGENEAIEATQKNNDFRFFCLFGGGFSDPDNFEVDLLAYNHNLFNSKRFLVQYNALRMDVKTYEEDETTIIAVSLGSILAYAVFGLLPRAFENDKISSISKPLVWLSSGGTEFTILGFPLWGISIAETHAFKWYIIQNHYYDDEAHYKLQFDDIGYSEEFGLKLGLLLATVSGGVRVEATTKGVDVGWFIKGLVLPIIPDFY